MKRTILTHVGTSLFGSEAFTRTYSTSQARNLQCKLQTDPWYDTKKDEPACRAALITGLRDYWESDADDWKRRHASPAEIASLSLLNLQPGDRVVLVSSDTRAGSFCAHLIRESLNELRRLPFSTEQIDLPPVRRLEGVETQDGKAFVDSGLPAYMNLIADERQGLAGDIDHLSAEHVQILFNITGGYKGLIPFAMIAAQLLASHPTRKVASELVYYHEEGSQVIEVNAFFPLVWAKLRDIYPRIERLCKYPGSTESRQMCSDKEMRPYCTANGTPNALAVALYNLIRTLGWIGS